MNKEEKLSKRACDKIRETFSDTISKYPKGDPSERNKEPLNWSDDNVIIDKFKDEWTWYMQGAADRNPELEEFKTVNEQYHNANLLLQSEAVQRTNKIIDLEKQLKQYHSQEPVDVEKLREEFWKYLADVLEVDMLGWTESVIGTEIFNFFLPHLSQPK